MRQSKIKKIRKSTVLSLLIRHLFVIRRYQFFKISKLKFVFWIANMVRGGIFLIFCLAIISSVQGRNTDCKSGSTCETLCCTENEVCCQRSLATLEFYCSEKCTAIQSGCPVGTFQCGSACCDHGDKCCYDSWSGTNFCDENSCEIK